MTDKGQDNYRLHKPTSTYSNENPVLSGKPDLLALINENGHKGVTIEYVKDFDQYLNNNYIFLNSFSQETGILFEIWKRKDFTNF